jgi:DNA polymerase III epsilon subunit-like protein
MNAPMRWPIAASKNWRVEKANEDTTEETTCDKSFSTPKPPASTRVRGTASSKLPASRWSIAGLTGRHLHKYTNPEREIDEGAQAVHGITLEFLADKPKFADIVDEFLEFINGAELIIHNAPFDLGFLNAELRRLDRVPVETVCNRVTDTLKMAKELHPGKRNNLNALCDRYEIDNSQPHPARRAARHRAAG